MSGGVGDVPRISLGKMYCDACRGWVVPTHKRWMMGERPVDMPKCPVHGCDVFPTEGRAGDLTKKGDGKP